MALTADKTWSFFSFNWAYTGSTYTSMRAYMYNLKEMFVSMGWTVEGGRSPSGGLHNNDQVDVWPTEATASHTSDTWMHLKAPAPLEFEIVFGAFYSSNDGESRRLSVNVSHSDGFGAVNGSSDGTTTAFPNALDQQVIQDDTNTTESTPYGMSFNIYGSKTSDNKNHRIMCYHRRVCSSFFSFETLDNPHANLDNNGQMFAVRRSKTTDTPSTTVMDQDYYTSALYYGRVSGVNRSFYLGTVGYANLGMQSHLPVLQDNKIRVHPTDLYNNTIGIKGYYGTIPDLYYGSNGHYTVLLGDTVGGAANWMSGGSVVTPWDPTEPLARIY
jgi:hypothetical protein